jgi:tyrosinase
LESYISTLTRILGLTPFWKSQTRFWTSSDIVTTSSLNYSYPEFNGLNMDDPQAVSTAIKAYVKSKYDVGESGNGNDTEPGVSPLTQPLTATGATPATEAPKSIYNWGALVHTKRFELDHSYTVSIFLGDVPEDPEDWLTSPSFVGFHAAFANHQIDLCANCSKQRENVISSLVCLNKKIVERSGLSSFEPCVIAPYLKNNLHWRVQMV